MRKFIVGPEQTHPNSKLDKGKLTSVEIHGKVTDLMFLSTTNVDAAKRQGVSQPDIAKQIRSKVDECLAKMMNEPPIKDMEFLMLYADLDIL